MMRYTVMRLLLFFGFVCLLWLVGLRAVPLVIAAGVLSAIVSYFLLRGPRQAFSRQIAERVDARAQRAVERAQAARMDEDEDEEL